MTLRAADRKTGVNYGTLSNMTMGQIPEMESVVKFAQGFNLDTNEWLALADYPPVINGARRLFDGLDQIRQETGVNFTVNADELAAALDPPEVQDRLLAQVRARVEQRQAQGGA